MPFVAPKSSTSGNAAGGRSSFRPPWVKEDGSIPLKPTSAAKTTPPWAKKPATTTNSANSTTEKANGEKATAAAAPTAAKKSGAAAAKVVETKPPQNELKKPLEADKKPNNVAAVKKPEAAKVTELATKKSNIPNKTIPAKTAAPVKKKEPTPPPSSSSEEEEEDEDEEEETEEEESEEESESEASEEESEASEATNKTASNTTRKIPQQQPQKQEEESELKRRFSLEKPKLRPVVVKRDKSMKKIEDDEEAEEGETEEERERRLRFKLEKPKLRHVKREEKPLPSKSTENVLKIRPVLKKVPKVDELIKEPKEEPKPEFKTKTLRKAPSIKREPSKASVPAPPPLPSLVPKAPPPPPPPGGAPLDKRELTEKQKAALERLKTRPRRRPDWSEMMKEVEDGRKLRHVECNDRSQPILTCKSITKVDDKFVFETEKANSHNKLLKQIQSGVKLRPTQTNDRSKPLLDGLRKFRRQMTIEEQIQKSQSKINMLAAAAGAAGTDGTNGTTGVTAGLISALSIDDPSGDELDDIDKIRDDLQSTKQMLALELRNREAQERENKKLLAKITTLEAELEREKSREKNFEYGSRIIVATMEPTLPTEEHFVNSLKKEAEDAKNTSKDLEQKYQNMGELLDQAKSEIEEQKRQIQKLERQLAQALQGNISPGIRKTSQSQFNFCYSYEDPNDSDTLYASSDGEESATKHNAHNNHIKPKGGSLNGSRRPSDALGGRDSSDEFDLQASESDPDEPEEKKQERRERKLGKEIKVLKSKLTKLKVKQETAKKEKDALKQAMRKNHVILKEENKKFKKLEKEVHKMAASMKEEEEDADESEDEDKEEAEAAEEEEEEESEEESEESESEASEPETASESEAEDATNADKKTNLEPRVKKHESRLSAMKKCNVLLQANVDNLQDEITQVRAKAASLQAELDSVLQDLGF